MTTKAEIATLQTAWRTAATRPDGLTIACPDVATARNLRFRLYNAVKPFRDGKAQPDPALAEALGVLKVGVTIDPPSVSLTRKCVVDLVSAALADAGVSIDAAVTAEDLAVADSLARVNALAAAGEARASQREGLIADAFAFESRTIDPLEERDSFPSSASPTANPFFTRGEKPGESH